MLLSAFQGYPSTTNGCSGIAKRNFGDVDLYVLSFASSGTKYAQWVLTPDTRYNSISIDILWTYITGSGATVKWQAENIVFKDDLNVSYENTMEAIGNTEGVNKKHTTNITLNRSGEKYDLVNLRIARKAGEDSFNGVAKIIGLKINLR